MNERDFLDVISGRRSGPAAALLRCGLSLVTPWYRAAIGARNAFFDSGLRRIHHVDVPVVSVGNLTTGGTGKTPIVAWIADWFSTSDKSPCIISRGYRSLDDAGNDERRVLEQLCPGVPHLQSRDRVLAARMAIADGAPDVLILDDGFQHRRLARDVDLVVVDALNPWGYGRLLPRGLLREPKSSLLRADAVIITRADQIDETARSALRDEIARWTPGTIVEAAFCPSRLLDVNGQTRDLNALSGQPVFAFCAIGNPDGFRRTLQDAGLIDVAIEAFADHHHYSQNDLRRLTETAQQAGARAMVTTQKDLVKLHPDWQGDVPIWGMTIETKLHSGRDHIEQLLTGLHA